MNETGLENWEAIPLLSRICDKKTICKVEKKWIKILSADLNTYTPLDTLNKWNYVGQEKLKRELYLNNLKTKRYHCGVCDKAFGKSDDLKRHFKSLKHSCTFMNSLD